MSESGSHRWSRSGALLIGGLTLLALFVLACEAVPLGVPGEWTWARRNWTAIEPVSVVLCLLCGVCYGLGVVWGERRWSHSRGAPLWISLLALIWFGGVLWSAPGFQGLGRAPTILYYKRTEGYFWQAAFDVHETRSFLHSYQTSISTGNDPDRYLHLGTHPPGLTLLYRGALQWAATSPGLVSAIISTEPHVIHDAFDALRQFPTPHDKPLTQVEEATLWGAASLTLLMTALTCWPIYGMILRMSGPTAAWRGAALWPLVPSLLVFYPKSDLLCPLIATTSCWLWIDGWSNSRRIFCLLAGIGFFVGSMLTLAFAPVALLLVLQTIIERWLRRDEFHERTATSEIVSVLVAVFGFTIPAIALSVWGECNLLGIWIENLRNHAMFYDHNSRSYVRWLLVNPFEGALALGTPLACLLSAAVFKLGKSTRSTAAHRAIALTGAWMITWGILWLSGKNMGEAARLWIFLAPWPVMTAATMLSPKDNSAEVPAVSRHEFSLSPANRSWVLFLILQGIATLWTFLRVDGFHFDELTSM